MGSSTLKAETDAGSFRLPHIRNAKSLRDDGGIGSRASSMWEGRRKYCLFILVLILIWQNGLFLSFNWSVDSSALFACVMFQACGTERFVCLEGKRSEEKRPMGLL